MIVENYKLVPSWKPDIERIMAQEKVADFQEPRVPAVSCIEL